MDLLSPLNHWHWWIIAAALAIAEMLLPGMFLIWIGAAAAVAGFLVLALPDLAWEGQVLAFAGLAMVAALIGRRVYAARGVAESDHPLLNRRAQQYVGQTFLLDGPIVGGSGRLRVGDGTWKVSGPDCPAGTRVAVVGADGTVLRVAPAESTAEPAA